jgi:hypothetical protein
VLALGPLFLAGSLFVSSYLNASNFFVFVPIGGIFVSSLPIILSAIALVQSQTMWKTPKPLLNPSHFLPLNVLEPILRCSLFL